MMAKQFEISTSGFYKHINKKKVSSNEDAFVLGEVNKVRQLMPRIGTRKLHHILNPLLKSEGLKYGRDKLFDLLRKEIMLVPRRTNYLTTTRSYKRFKKHPNRIADLEIRRPEQVWVSDITYIRTKDGFQYLTLITDAYSKKIMGYKLSDNMRTENNVAALEMALRNRKYPKRKLIHHSDRGFQYCADEYIKKLGQHKIKVSMTTKYDPYENAVAERVNGILKQEFLISDKRIPKEEAYYIIKQSIETYNNLRPHYSCEYLTPAQAHRGRKFKMKTYSTTKVS